jgi:hypothetical protein
MDYETLRYERDGHVTVLTYDRPNHRNAASRQMNRELANRVCARQGEFVLVITGEGDASVRLGSRGRRRNRRGRPAGLGPVQDSVYNTPGECGYTRRVDVSAGDRRGQRLGGRRRARGTLCSPTSGSPRRTLSSVPERRWNIVGSDSMNVRLTLAVATAARWK